MVTAASPRNRQTSNRPICAQTTTTPAITKSLNINSHNINYLKTANCNLFVLYMFSLIYHQMTNKSSEAQNLRQSKQSIEPYLLIYCCSSSCSFSRSNDISFVLIKSSLCWPIQLLSCISHYLLRHHRRRRFHLRHQCQKPGHQRQLSKYKVTQDHCRSIDKHFDSIESVLPLTLMSLLCFIAIISNS